MSAFAGPSTVTSGLVFDYDMSNTQKSWKGAATTNLVDPSWASWATDGSGQGSIGTRTITDTYECTIVDSTANTRQSIYITSGISASTVYTFSVQYKKLYGTPTLRFQIQAYNGGTYLSTMSFATTAQLGITNISDWQTAQIALTTPASTNRILWFMQDGDDYTTYTHSFSLKNVQCEQQSFATPFVVGTRSTTQAIVDLTGKNTLTTGSLTYESGGEFSFNGSSNYMDVTGSGFTSGMTGYTFNHWSRRDVESRMPLCSRSGPLFYQYGDNSWYYTHGGVAGEYYYPHAVSIPVGTWGFYSIVYNGSNVSIYRNGILEGSQATTGTADWSNGLKIGMYTGAGYYYQGKIGSVKFYNRALTAAEVSQEFNALRGRYGL
jgi:hypothetical protein